MRRSTEVTPRGIDTDPGIGGGVRAIHAFVIAAATAILVLSGLSAGVAFASNSFSYTASNTNSAQQNTVNQSIALNAGDQLSIGTCGVTGSTFTGDTYLRLRNPSGTQVALNDDACGTLGSRIVYTAPTAGNHEIRAGCYGNTSCSGTVVWTIGAGPAPAPTPTPPPPTGGSLDHQATNTNSAQQNTANRAIFLYSGQTLTIGTCGVTGSTSTGDTYLRLRNPSGTQMAANDDACSTIGSRIVFTAPAAGYYDVRAGCFGSTSCTGRLVWTIQ
jgi:hypothetical protein